MQIRLTLRVELATLPYKASLMGSKLDTWTIRNPIWLVIEPLSSGRSGPIVRASMCINWPVLLPALVSFRYYSRSNTIACWSE